MKGKIGKIAHVAYSKETFAIKIPSYQPLLKQKCNQENYLKCLHLLPVFKLEMSYAFGLPFKSFLPLLSCI